MYFYNSISSNSLNRWQNNIFFQMCNNYTIIFSMHVYFDRSFQITKQKINTLKDMAFSHLAATPYFCIRQKGIYH